MTEECILIWSIFHESIQLLQKKVPEVRRTLSGIVSEGSAEAIGGLGWR